MDEVVDRDNWTVVVAFGRYQELDDSPAQRLLPPFADELLQFHAAWWLPGGLKPESAHEHRTPLLYRIEIVQLTGRRATPGDLSLWNLAAKFAYRRWHERSDLTPHADRGPCY